MIRAHVPIDRRHALAEERELPSRCVGAALFADVSGFSALASKLADELGPRRAPEALLERLNPVLSSLVEVVHGFSGAVVSFAGDAITCWFDDDAPHVRGKSSGARRALACGLAMTAAMDALRAKEEGSIALKVAIAAGPARRMLVGDPRILVIDALAGSTLVRMARAERAASPGEVVVSHEVLAPARALLVTPKDATPGQELYACRAQSSPPARIGWPAEPQLEAARLESWVPEPLLRTLVGSGDRPHVMADLRAVVPMFASFDGIEYDTDDHAHERLDALVRWAQSVVQRAGGTLLQLTIGDKGSYLYGLFGAPTAHPDNARRAAAAALELSRPPVELSPSPLRIGLSYGHAWAGVVGATARSCYTVMGDEVNLAARLMQCALPGEIVATHAIALAANGFRFESRPDVLLKGRSKPLAVLRLVSRKEAQALEQTPDMGPIIGREEELARVQAAFPTGQEGAARVAVIEAAAGMGKTRMAQELGARAQGSGVRALVGRGDTVERDTPLRAWRSIFFALLQIEEQAPLDEIEARVAERVSDLDPPLADKLPLLNALLQTRFAETELTRWMTDEVRADNTRETSLRLLCVLRASPGDGAPSPWILVFDDGHWIDSASWALLRRVWQDMPDVLAVILRRPASEEDHPPAKEYDALADDPTTVHVILGSLEEEQTLQLVRSKLRVGALPTRLSTFVTTRAAGHPLLADQLTEALREAGHIRVEAGRCVLEPRFDESAVDLPTSVEGVIASRLDRLEPADQGTLKVASVLGLTFDDEALLDLLGGRSADAPAALYASLDRLVTLGFVSRTREGCSFRHAIVRDVAYQRLLFSRRNELHRAAAGHYAHRYGDDLSGWHAVLAHHYVRGDEPTKAAEQFGHAGELALRAGAFRETTVFFERAMDLAPSDLDARTRAQWLRRAASAWYRLGDLPKSTAAAEAAVAVFDRPLPRSSAALAGHIAGELFGQLKSRLYRRRPHTEPADVQGDLRSAVGIYQNLSEVYYLGGMQGPSIYTALRQVNVGERAGVSEELAEAYGVLSIIAGLVGASGLSSRYEKLAEEVVVKLENPRARAMSWHQRSLSNAAVGRFARVRDDETRAIATFSRLGEIGRKRDALGLLGTTEYLASRYDSAETILSELLATRTGTDRFVQEIWGSAWLGGVALARGHLEIATQRFEHSLELLDRNTVGLMEISCLGFLGLARLRRGDDEGARAPIEKAYSLIEAARGRPTGHISLDGYAAVAEAYLHWASTSQPRSDSRSDSNSMKRARRACRWLRGFAKAFPIGAPAASLFSGQVQALDGDRTGARRTWERGLRTARDLGMRCEEGRLLLALSSADGLARRDLARRALRTFESVGATYYAELSQNALRREEGSA